MTSAKKNIGPSQDAAVVDGAQQKKSILIYSPDLNFCFSLSMLFQDRYIVSTTTNLAMLETFAANSAADLVVIDAVPSAQILERLDSLRETRQCLRILMLYVYNAKDTEFDQRVRNHVDTVFYKPFDVNTVSQRIEELLTV